MAFRDPRYTFPRRDGQLPVHQYISQGVLRQIEGRPYISPAELEFETNVAVAQRRWRGMRAHDRMLGHIIASQEALERNECVYDEHLIPLTQLLHEGKLKKRKVQDRAIRVMSPEDYRILSDVRTMRVSGISSGPQAQNTAPTVPTSTHNTQITINTIIYLDQHCAPIGCGPVHGHKADVFTEENDTEDDGWHNTPTAGPRNGGKAKRKGKAPMHAYKPKVLLQREKQHRINNKPRDSPLEPTSRSMTLLTQPYAPQPNPRPAQVEQSGSIISKQTREASKRADELGKLVSWLDGHNVPRLSSSTQQYPSRTLGPTTTKQWEDLTFEQTCDAHDKARECGGLVAWLDGHAVPELSGSVHQHLTSTIGSQPMWDDPYDYSTPKGPGPLLEGMDLLEDEEIV